MDYDVVVVGGSFAGLTNAYFLAQEGLKVCLLERGKIAEFTKSTGALTQSVIDDLDVPAKLIENEIDKYFIYSPSMKKYKYSLSKPLFFQSHTLDFLKWLKKQNKELNVDIKENIDCRNFEINSNLAKCEGIKSRLIVFATGILPRSLQRLHNQKVNYYHGLEYIVDGMKIEDEHAWQSYFDYNISPGYFSWISPINRKRSHVGILKKVGEGTNPTVAIKKLFKKIGSRPSKIYERRAGIVPLSGPLPKTYGNRYIIVGDAAGHIGAFSCAGINYSTRIAKATSKTIANNIDDPSEYNLRKYEIIWKQEVGGLLKQELLLRKAFDKINTNDKLEYFLKLLSKADNKRVARIMEKFTNFEGSILKYVFLLFT